MSDVRCQKKAVGQQIEPGRHNASGTATSDLRCRHQPTPNEHFRHAPTQRRLPRRCPQSKSRDESRGRVGRGKKVLDSHRRHQESRGWRLRHTRMHHQEQRGEGEGSTASGITRKFGGGMVPQRTQGTERREFWGMSDLRSTVAQTSHLHEGSEGSHRVAGG